MSGDSTHWYEDAVVYAIDVKVFQDSDGDGTGDFRGLITRLDYLNHVGIDCIWLLPFYPSPNRDNGYDVTDYYDVDPDLGTLGDFVDFLREAEERGIHVVIDLVVNHTSDQHPWFQAAREDPDSKYRDYYVWSEEPPDVERSPGTVFPGEVEDGRVWTYDSTAGAYYYHRFYPFQPDLDLYNPRVREEVRKVMGFWLRLGVSGFRVDAATLLIQEKQPGRPQPENPHKLLREFHSYASRYRGDAVLMAEADDDPAELSRYFGDGAEMDLLFNFLLDASLFEALATGRADALAEGLDRLPVPPEGSSWLNFLRNYDELNLGRLDEDAREAVYEAFAPEPEMRIYGRGIRRRLAPMLRGSSARGSDGVSASEASGDSSEQRSGGDVDRLKMAFSLLFSMPGTPLFVYGDEIGMGEDLSLPGRDAVRTPMQWDSSENAGFSTADPDDLFRPVVSDGPFAFESVNVADQWSDQDSILNFVEHLVGTRMETAAIPRGTLSVLDTGPESVFAHCYDHDGATVGMVHNLTAEPTSVALPLDCAGDRLVDLLGNTEFSRHDDGTVAVELGRYGFRWLRVDRQPVAASKE